MRNYAIILSFLLVVTSCRKKGSSDLITGQNFKYWLVTDSINKKTKTFYYFDKNGKWVVFKKYADGEFTKLDRGDIYFIETWQLINDSTVDIGTKKHHIEKISEVEFVNTDIENGSTQKLVVAPDSLIPSKYNKFQ